jgi:replicative DNA helicase
MTILADGMPDYVRMAEEYVVGGALLGLTASEVMRVDCNPRDFRDHRLGLVWYAIQNVAASEMEPTIPNVCEHLREGGHLDKIGAEPAIVELTAGHTYIYSNLACVTAHAAILTEWARKRELIQAASEVARTIYETKVPEQSDRMGEMPL